MKYEFVLINYWIDYTRVRAGVNKCKHMFPQHIEYLLNTGWNSVIFGWIVISTPVF